MSYNIRILSGFGVKITHEVATKIMNNHFEDCYMSFFVDRNIITDDNAEDHLCGMSELEANHPDHGSRNPNVFVYDLGMFTHNPNPYDEVDTTFDYDPNIDHYFGIYMADSGRGHNIAAFVATPPQVVRDYFETYARPILKKYGIDDSPAAFVVQQAS